MMELNLDDLTVHVPLKRLSDGSIRIGERRMLLYIVIQHYQQGYSAADIVDSFDTLKIGDVYAILAYYHQHQEEIDAYVKWIEDESEQQRLEYEAKQTPEQRESHEKLIAKLKAYRAKQRYTDDLNGFFGQPFE